MPEIVADPPSPSCCHLFLTPRIQQSQQLGPNPFLPRARDGCGRFVKGSSGNPRGRARGIPNPKRGARPCYSAADRAGAVGSDRPHASFVAAARRATLTNASRFDRPGEASGDRPAAVAQGRGFFAGADQRSDRDRARRDHARPGAQIAERVDARLRASRRPARLMRWWRLERVLSAGRLDRRDQPCDLPRRRCAGQDRLGTIRYRRRSDHRGADGAGLRRASGGPAPGWRFLHLRRRASAMP